MFDQRVKMKLFYKAEHQTASVYSVREYF